VRRQLLFFTKSAGYEHSVIKPAGSAPGHAERVLRDLAARHGWEVRHTKDGSAFTEDTVARTDAFVFYTTGDLTTPGTDGTPPLAREAKAGLLEAIRTGKGFVGIHCATDTFHSPGDRFAAAGERADPYIRMLGGEFLQHGAQQTATLRGADPSFPGCADLKDGIALMEEWYSFKNYREDLHVIFVQETAGMDKTGTNSVYDRPPYPATWARMHGKGRVFYTSMGHREDVWAHPSFQRVLAGGLAWALGQVDADVTPNLPLVAPGYALLPPEPR
jgi:type 1 glutamine amidotransferase